MPFKKINPKIKSLLAALGFEEPTPSQVEAIPHLLKDRNLLLIAPTGIGKTEAAVIPIFHRFLELKKTGVFEDENGFFIIYITPLRALNRDMLRRLEMWGNHLGIKIGVRHGDTTQAERNRQSRHPPEMLITTPESFQLMFTGKNLRNSLLSVRWVVLDEVHEVAGSDRGAQLAIALERLEALIANHLLEKYRKGKIDKERLKKDVRKKDRMFVRVGLSATVGSPRKIAEFLKGNPASRTIEIVDVSYEKKMEIRVERPEVTEEVRKLAPKLEITEELSSLLLASAILHTKKLMDSHTSILFFVNTRNTAEMLSSRFSLAFPHYPLNIHHGSLYKDVRMEMEDKFKSGEIKALICTSSLELGIDVGSTDLVIQFNSPRRMERLIQRVGRGGHGIGRTSKGVVVVTDFDNIAEAAVISKNTLKRKVEASEIRMKPLDVLANQLVAMANAEKAVEIEKAFEIVKGAYPFKNLGKGTFSSLLEFLNTTGLIYLHREKKMFYKSRETIPYFYSNISMIPDERSFVLRDLTNGKEIGFLDEVYVIQIQSSLNKGEVPVFVVKGRSWMALSVEEEKDEVNVVPNTDPSTPPKWLGMDIPVSFEVAREVGCLRKAIRDQILTHIKYINNSKDLNIKIFKKISSLYPLDFPSFQTLFEFIYYHLKNGLPVANHKLITVEQSTKHIIINSCFGTKVNETLSQLVTYFLVEKERVGASVLSDAYRVIVDRPGGISAKDIKNFLLSFNPSTLKSVLKKVVVKSELLHYQMFFTGKKFGVIKEKASWRKIDMRKVVEAYRDSLFLEECVEKVIWEWMDIPNTKKVLRHLQKGEIKIEVTRLTPIGKLGIEVRKSVTSPERAKEQILEALKTRLENTVRILVCLNCGFKEKKVVKDLPEKLRCKVCGGVMLASLSQYNLESINIVKKVVKGVRLQDKEIKEYKKILKNANLVKEYGREAVLCLSGRGVGETKAAQILSKYLKDEKRLLEEILKAEIHFARYKRFWD